MSSETMTGEQADGDVRAARDAIVEAVLPQVAFDGWTMKTVAAAATDAGLPHGTAERLFPKGVVDLLGHLSDLSDRKMLAAMTESGETVNRTRDRLAMAVRLRIEVNAPYKEFDPPGLLVSGPAPEHVRRGAKHAAHGRRPVVRGWRHRHRLQLLHQARTAGAGLCCHRALLAR